MEYFSKLINKGHPNRGGSIIKPIGGVFHYTGNESKTATEMNHAKYVSREYKRDSAGNAKEADGSGFSFVSAHWYIDENDAVLCIPQNEVSWHSGDRQYSLNNGYNGQTKIAKQIFENKANYKTISYEICNNSDWEKACDNAVLVAARDFVKYGIDVSAAYRHFDITGKQCPYDFVKNTVKWDVFTKKLGKEINRLKKLGYSTYYMPNDKVLLNGFIYKAPCGCTKVLDIEFKGTKCVADRVITNGTANVLLSRLGWAELTQLKFYS